MKKIFIAAIIIFNFYNANSQSKNFIDQPYLEVTGFADTLVTPDEIYIRINISESDTRNKTSLEELETQMVNALKSIGIETEKDLKINNISSFYKQYILKGKDVIKTKQYTLKVTDAETATNVFVQLENLNISNTSIEKIDNANLDNIKIDVLSKAVTNAKTKAVVMAKSLNQTIGASIQIVETNADINNNYFASQSAGSVGAAYRIAIRGQSDYQPQQIDYDKIRVATNVNVKFILNNP